VNYFSSIDIIGAVHHRDAGCRKLPDERADVGTRIRAPRYLGSGRELDSGDQIDSKIALAICRSI
jgi:hypothetical protein